MKTVQRHLLAWQRISRRKAYYPFTQDVVSCFILYMIENVQVAPATLYSYISTIKGMHTYQGYSLSGIEDPRVKLLLRGYKHIYKTLHPKVGKRKVMHWETLQIFGSELCDTAYDYETKQAIWTAVLFTFWSSTRYGDFMPGSQGVVKEKLLTWDRIQMPDDDHAAIYLHFPKHDREGDGEAKDIVRFHDKLYCPIYNFEHLLEVRRLRRPVARNEPVFLTSADRLVRMSTVRHALSTCLDKYYPDSAAKINCHSARAGLSSFLGTCPELYTVEEIRRLGKWSDGESYKRYCRTDGIGTAKLLRKIASNFR